MKLAGSAITCNLWNFIYFNLTLLIEEIGINGSLNVGLSDRSRPQFTRILRFLRWTSALNRFFGPFLAHLRLTTLSLRFFTYFSCPFRGQLAHGFPLSLSSPLHFTLLAYSHKSTWFASSRANNENISLTAVHYSFTFRATVTSD